MNTLTLNGRTFRLDFRGGFTDPTGAWPPGWWVFEQGVEPSAPPADTVHAPAGWTHRDGPYSRRSDAFRAVARIARGKNADA